MSELLPDAPEPQTVADPELLHGADRFAADAALPANPQPVTISAPDVRVLRRAGVFTSFLLVLQVLLFCIVIAMFANSFLVQAFQIPSVSMKNTLLVGDFLLVDKLRFAQAGPWERLLPYEPVERGEVVVFHYPVQPSQYFVKRVIGLPGDRIRIYEKRVWVNGERMQDRDYALYTSGSDLYRDDFPSMRSDAQVDPQWLKQMHSLDRDGQLTIPKGEYFVMGDNRDDSADSRYWGFVPRSNIVGLPLVIYFSAAPGAPAAGAEDGKLTGFALHAEAYVQNIRWKRLMQVVH